MRIEIRLRGLCVRYPRRLDLSTILRLKTGHHFGGFGMRYSLAALLLTFTATSANAATILFDVSPFTGGPDSSALVTLDDSVAGFITVTVDVTGAYDADIRGVFFSVDSAFGEIAGADIGKFGFGTCDLGNGNNLNGGGSGCISPGGFDVGLSIGTPGIGMDDIMSTVFTIETLGVLTLADFVDFGVRLTSVGLSGSGREDSSKLYSNNPVPLPAAGWLFASALFGAGFMRKKKTA